jgi:hypothetical protein
MLEKAMTRMDERESIEPEQMDELKRLVDGFDEAHDGNGGDDATYRAICEIVRMQLNTDNTWELIDYYNGKYCHGPWENNALERKLHSALGANPSGEEFDVIDVDLDQFKPVNKNSSGLSGEEVLGKFKPLTNFTVLPGKGNRPKFAPKPLPKIMREIADLTNAWPRRVDTDLFVVDQRHGLSWFDHNKTASLFGWLQQRCLVNWKNGSQYVKQGEILAELERTAEKYGSIETQPHEPMMADTYYHCDIPEPGDGKTLAKLLDRFQPATDTDRELIKAAILTTFWGGPAGCRPAFVITSDEGRGAGKSTLAHIIAGLAGGYIDVAPHEDNERLKQRLLSPNGRDKRVATIDNIKDTGLS